MQPMRLAVLLPVLLLPAPALAAGPVPSLAWGLPFLGVLLKTEDDVAKVSVH